MMSVSAIGSEHFEHFTCIATPLLLLRAVSRPRHLPTGRGKSLPMVQRYAHLSPSHAPPLSDWRPGPLHGRRHVRRVRSSTVSSTEASRRLRGAIELREVVGSPGWARTSDFLINSQALYRLSYRGIVCSIA